MACFPGLRVFELSAKAGDFLPAFTDALLVLANVGFMLGDFRGQVGHVHLFDKGASEVGHFHPALGHRGVVVVAHGS